MDRARVSFCVDTIEGARAAAEFFDARGATAQILVEVDCGYGRCGVPWNAGESVRFVQAVSADLKFHMDDSQALYRSSLTTGTALRV